MRTPSGARQTQVDCATTRNNCAMAGRRARSLTSWWAARKAPGIRSGSDVPSNHPSPSRRSPPSRPPRLAWRRRCRWAGCSNCQTMNSSTRPTEWCWAATPILTAAPTTWANFGPGHRVSSCCNGCTSRRKARRMAPASKGSILRLPLLQNVIGTNASGTWSATCRSASPARRRWLAALRSKRSPRRPSLRSDLRHRRTNHPRPAPQPMPRRQTPQQPMQPRRRPSLPSRYRPFSWSALSARWHLDGARPAISSARWISADAPWADWSATSRAVTCRRCWAFLLNRSVSPRRWEACCNSPHWRRGSTTFCCLRDRTTSPAPKPWRPTSGRR